MVSFKVFTFAALFTAIAEAAVAPSYPSPGTIQVQGQTYDITWTFDGKNPNQTYKIDFMTGSNTAQKVLKTIAKDVPANSLKYSFTAPEVSPNAAIYFFMFTGSDGDTAWTTRFGIVPSANAKLTTEPESTQPGGEKIPWGVGQLAGSNSSAAVSSASVSAAAVASSPAISSVAVASSSGVISSSAVVVSSSAVVASSGVIASSGVVASPSPAAGTKTSAGSLLEPTLSFLAAGLAGYFFF
ncbi:hypothetical protein BY458DRAFT_539285 [Sporodiniella umbellata]|nr:hypothetical protein BY458DRAFT_539285 [Sporodiniella umbellata]